MKKILIGIGLFLAAVVAFIAFAIARDQENMELASNPCERACVQDSGGIVGCRQDCASHPNSYGPNTYPPDPQPH